MQKCGIQVEVGNRVWSSGKKCKCESDSRRDGVGSGMPAWDYPGDRVDTGEENLETELQNSEAKRSR